MAKIKLIIPEEVETERMKGVHPWLLSGEAILWRGKLLFNDFIDPDVYKQGLSMSFVGTIGQTQQGKIGEYVYTYPVIEATGYYLWQPERKKSHVEVDYSPLWFRHNFYSPYYPYRYPVPVRVRVQDNSGTPAKDRN